MSGNLRDAAEGRAQFESFRRTKGTVKLTILPQLDRPKVAGNSSSSARSLGHLVSQIQSKVC